ncbi:MAG: hypothetical protein BYD32DRAFT_461981 [Podila humilis]|nr:MAG: hypothetical protein BYD32DRAFT_461981 [Podila humilis]
MVSLILRAKVQAHKQVTLIVTHQETVVYEQGLEQAVQHLQMGLAQHRFPRWYAYRSYRLKINYYGNQCERQYQGNSQEQREPQQRDNQEQQRPQERYRIKTCGQDKSNLTARNRARSQSIPTIETTSRRFNFHPFTATSAINMRATTTGTSTGQAGPPRSYRSPKIFAVDIAASSESAQQSTQAIEIHKKEMQD